jgi:NAD(P)H-flavin reductase
MSTARFSVELLARTALTARVHRLRFAGHPTFRWDAGQHLIVVRGKGQDVFLPYSIASAYDPRHPGEFELAVAYGAGADVIDVLSAGERVDCEGPFGDFVWQIEPRPAALLVGVGTGVAPLRALIEEELARASQTRLLLIAGHRAPEDVLFSADFAALAQAHSRFRFLPTLTGAGEGWLGDRGRVQAQLAAATQDFGIFDAYVCGRSEMVIEVVAALTQRGVGLDRIRSEGF